MVLLVMTFNTLTALASKEAAEIRRGRVTFTGLGNRRFGFVVWVEKTDGTAFELDADNEAHAVRLAQNWTRQIWADGKLAPLFPAVTSASVQKVKPSGKTKLVGEVLEVILNEEPA